MNATQERKIDKLLKTVEQMATYNRWVPIEKFCSDKGYSRRQVDYMREQNPKLWKGQGGKEVDSKGRTIWRDILIDVIAWNEQYTSPVR